MKWTAVLPAGALEKRPQPPQEVTRALALCDTFWGSHGCVLRPGHAGVHRCTDELGDLCSEFDSEKKEARYLEVDFGSWSPWMPNPGLD